MALARSVIEMLICQEWPQNGPSKPALESARPQQHDSSILPASTNGLNQVVRPATSWLDRQLLATVNADVLSQSICVMKDPHCPSAGTAFTIRLNHPDSDNTDSVHNATATVYMYFHMWQGPPCNWHPNVPIDSQNTCSSEAEAKQAAAVFPGEGGAQLS